MATFTYECSNCGERWEESRDRSDPDLDRSQQRRCGHRVFDPGAVTTVFRGAGWARKDRNAEADD